MYFEDLDDVMESVTKIITADPSKDVCNFDMDGIKADLDRGLFSEKIAYDYGVRDCELRFVIARHEYACYNNHEDAYAYEIAAAIRGDFDTFPTFKLPEPDDENPERGVDFIGPFDKLRDGYLPGYCPELDFDMAAIRSELIAHTFLTDEGLVFVSVPRKEIARIASKHLRGLRAI